MGLEIRLLAGVFLLTLMFSAIACADNLLIGGIMQKSGAVEKNSDYQEIAASLKAKYIPTYYGGFANDVIEVRNAALGIGSVKNGLLGLDGLPNKALDHHYDTIVAYSGGTSTAVTALADYARYGLTCDTLILVSPMAAAINEATKGNALTGLLTTGRGMLSGDIDDTMAGLNKIQESTKVADEEGDAKFEKQIGTILENNPGLKIIVIQSPQDKPTFYGETYQYTFTKDASAFKEFNNRITIHNEPLDNRLLLDNPHKDIFFEFAKTHLANDGSGIKFSPTAQSTRFSVADQSTNPNPFEANPVGKIGLQEAVALCIQGKYDEAIRGYKTANGLWTNFRPNQQMYFDIGDSLFQIGKFEEAIQIYQKILEDIYLDSNAIELSLAWERIGAALNNLGRTEEANQAFANAKEQKDKRRHDSQDLPLPTETWQEEDKMIRATGGYSQGSGSSGGLSPGQKQAIEQAIDNMVPGEYNQYYNTNPRFKQAIPSY